MIFRTTRLSKFTVWMIVIASIAAVACLCIWLWFRSQEEAINRQINGGVAENKFSSTKEIVAYQNCQI